MRKSIPAHQFWNPSQEKPKVIPSRLRQAQQRRIQEDRSVQYRIQDIMRYGTETEIEEITKESLAV